MKFKQGIRRSLYVLALTLGLVSAGISAPIIPVSYTAPEGQGHGGYATYSYLDETGFQLIDGMIGIDDWQADLGNGNAYEWVGWILTDPTITFQFNGPQTINTIQIGINRQDAHGLSTPTSVTIGDTLFPVGAEDIAFGTRAFLSFQGTWTGNSLSVTLDRRSNPIYTDSPQYVFVDEFKFFGNDNNTLPVPEPATAFLFGAGILGFLGSRRKIKE